MVTIYCYFVGIHQYEGKTLFAGISKYFDEFGQQVVLRQTNSTSEKWVKQDLGHKKVSGMVAYMGSYLESRRLYTEKFGKGNFTTVLLSGQNQFNQLNEKPNRTPNERCYPCIANHLLIPQDFKHSSRFKE